MKKEGRDLEEFLGQNEGMSTLEFCEGTRSVLLHPVNSAKDFDKSTKSKKRGMIEGYVSLAYTYAAVGVSTGIGLYNLIEHYIK